MEAISAPVRYVTDFYELPIDRVSAFREAATPRWKAIGSNRGRWSEMLASLRRPAPSYEESEPYLGALLAYLDEAGVVATQPSEHEELLTDLVEFHGGGWDLVEPRAGLGAELDPARFDESTLRRFYTHGDEDLPERDLPESGAAMLRALALFRQVLGDVGERSLLLLRYS